MRAFWKKHSEFDMSRPTMQPQAFYMEDKSSGLFLNQQFLKDGTVNVRPVPRDGTAGNDKFSRFLNTLPYFKAGRIRLPRSHEHYDYIKRELLGQSEYGSATGHDDAADNFSDAVSIAFANEGMSYGDWS
jgi:phage terminase large subunit-like protein